MQSMKVIKRRISSVSSTQKIMKAMDLVATSKLQKAKARLESILPMFEEAKRIANSLKTLDSVKDNVYIKQREVKNTAYIVITSDRGLCGGYNLNVVNMVMAHIGKERQEKIVAVGLKGWEFFRRRSKNILCRYVGMADTAFYKDAESIGSMIASMYTAGEVDEVYVAYTQFKSITSHSPHIEKIFPISASPDAESGAEPESGRGMDEREFVPDADTFVNYAAPMYINAYIYSALVEAAACEQAARMISMDAAANNATEIIDELSRMYNRIRQNAITQEISEIVGGADVHA